MVATCAAAFTSSAPSLLQARCRTASRAGVSVAPVCSLKATRNVAKVSKPAEVDFVKLAAASTAISTLLAAGNAQAAQEVASLAARDNRASTLLLLLAPALGWVAFNILGPALNQLKGMQLKGSEPSKRSARSARSAAIGLGLGAAALLSTQTADAADEIAQLSAGRDNRVLIIATLFLPVVGWVGFNILGPALNQLKGMQVKNTGQGSSGKNPLKKRR